MAEDSASWYQRKLSQMRGQQPAPFQGRPAVPQYEQPVARYQQQAPQAPQAPAATPETLSELLDLQQHGQALRPGKGARLNQDPCPNCGGNLYYADLGLKRRGPPPAPHCFNCGYNELFEQGLESTWQGGA
jgi:hypothetical protein